MFSSPSHFLSYVNQLPPSQHPRLPSRLPIPIHWSPINHPHNYTFPASLSLLHPGRPGQPGQPACINSNAFNPHHLHRPTGYDTNHEHYIINLLLFFPPIIIQLRKLPWPYLFILDLDLVENRCAYFVQIGNNAISTTRSIEVTREKKCQ